MTKRFLKEAVRLPGAMARRLTGMASPGTILPSNAASGLRRSAAATHDVLIVSNCATPFYRRAIERFCPTVRVTAYTVSEANTDRRGFQADCARNDIVLLLPLAQTYLDRPEELGDKLITIPPFYFSGYHPDTVYLTKPGAGQVSTPYGVYHSSLCFLGFEAGLSADETLRLFTDRVYDDMGFYALWQAERANLLGAFATAGIPLEARFRDWVRRGCFMHTINHPHVACLVDVARVIAGKLPVEMRDGDLPLPDALANSAIYPCYPEIAEANGCRGSYFFKPAQSDVVLTLPEFVGLCYDTYERHGRGTMSMQAGFEQKSVAFRDHVLGRFGA